MRVARQVSTPHLGYTPSATKVAPLALVTSTTLWPVAARLAMAFRDAGWQVELVARKANPGRLLDGIQRCYNYPVLGSSAALAAIAEDRRPDLIVPTDDRAAEDLLGSLRSKWLMPSPTRWGLAVLCANLAIPAPASARIGSMDNAVRFGKRYGYPFVLKVDGSWGGKGVLLVRSHAMIAPALASLQAASSPKSVVGRLLLEQDAFAWRDLLRAPSPEVTAQAFVKGRDANCAVACEDGRVLSFVGVDVLAASGGHGPAVKVKAKFRPDMLLAVERIVSELKLSGLYGFDFMIEDRSGTALVIEMNARPTRVCYLPACDGLNLVDVLSSQAFNVPLRSPSRTIREGETITYFPQAWADDHEDRSLFEGYHDVPWTEPALLRWCIRPKRSERNVVFRAARFGYGYLAARRP